MLYAMIYYNILDHDLDHVIACHAAIQAFPVKGKELAQLARGLGQRGVTLLRGFSVLSIHLVTVPINQI